MEITLQDILDVLNGRSEHNVNTGEWWNAFIAICQNTIRECTEFNDTYHTPDEIPGIFSRITGESVDPTTRVFPPFNADFGKNIHLGKNVFINAGCKFQDQGGIWIGDNALIGHNVVMATINHSLNPSENRKMSFAPIHIGNNVWIGSQSTILPGVTIGDWAVVAAGAVVTKDVPAYTVVGGVPARVLREIDQEDRAQSLECTANTRKGMEKPLRITKMHGLGNDFILTEKQLEDPSECAKRLCARRVSVGADGLILVCPSTEADVRMRIFNADGSEAEMCGNGIRCFARYVYDHHIVSSPSMTVETKAGIMRPTLILDQRGAVQGVRVDMGMPGFEPAEIPVATADPLTFNIVLAGQVYPASSVLMGVPHTVVFPGRPMSEEEILTLGPQIETYSLFPKKTNVNFVEILDDNTLRIRTWERGAGRTMACGTGSCASAVVACTKHLMGPKMTARLDAGDLEIEIAPDGRVYMTGPAAYVFDGQVLDE